MRHQFLVRAVARKTWFCLFFAGLSVSLSAVNFIAGAAPPPPPPPLPKIYFYQSPNPPPPDVPSEVLINEQFKFKVRFNNQNANTSFGYGPFIDLVLDAGGADIKKSCPTCDGITFVKAEMVGVSGGPVSLNSFLAFPPSPCSTTPATVTVNHPFGPFASSGIQQVTMPAGAQLVAIELPFGSFAPAQPGTASQPEIVVEVTASVNKFADDSVPVKISARGGFRYGTNPNNNPSLDPPVLSDQNPPGTPVTDSSLWSAQATTTPKVMILKKEYLGPEDETATGPNFPQKYKITVNIADGLTLNNVSITDCLPNNVVFTGINTAQSLPTPIPIPPPQTGPLNNNCVSFAYPTIVGTLLPAEIVIVFQFYVSQNDANGNPVLDPSKCVNAVSPNDIKAAAYWVPFDPCDWQGSSTPVKQFVTSDVSPVDHLLTDKRLAIQKSVEPYPVATAPLIPGGKLKYTLRLQVSDFFTVGGITVTDTLADGQAMLTNPAPMLTVGDRRGGPTVVPWSSGLTLLDLPNQFAPPCGGVNGGRSLIFQVSTAMQNNANLFADPVLKQGILTGGQAFTPVTSVPATGEIVFYAQIQDTFTYAHIGDKYVDKDDPINNCVSISGDIYTNHPTLPVPQSPPLRCTDDSKTLAAIVTDIISKKVYAVKRGTTFICGPSGTPCSNLPNLPQEVRPGDQVTFQIEKTIPSSDAEQLNIQDWLPLPVFNIAGISFTNTTCGIPTSGSGCLGPTDTLHTLVTPKPAFTAPPTTNSIKFDYGPNFNDPTNLPRKTDLLFTSTVTNQPFADGLFLTNEAQECENNTFGITFCQAAIAQVNLREPRLSITKGVVATDNPKGVFDPALNPSGIWKPFGTSCPAFNPPYIDANVGGLTNSNLSNVDANDSVTFAIAIENTGGAPAYEIELSDIIPLDPRDRLSCFGITSGLCVRRGNGPPIPFTTAIGGQGRTIIKLPGVSLDPLNSTTAVTGTNILIITFNAQLISDIKPGCCSNRADLLHYTSQPGGPDFVSAGFTPPFSDVATICVGPKALAKCIVQTSEPHTTPQNSGSGAPSVAIGEIIRYRLIASVPEGVSPNFLVKDILPPGLTYLGTPLLGAPRAGFVSTNPTLLTSSTLSGARLNLSGDENTVKCAPLPAPPLTFLIPAGAVTVGLGSGGDVTFDLGTLTNLESDTNLELVVIEFNALVNNIPSNVNGTQLTNKFEFSVDGQPFDQNNLFSVSAVVVEPNLVVNKTVSPMDAAGLNTCTMTLTNSGTTDAFDVHMTDTLPTGLFLVPLSPMVTVAPANCAVPTLTYSTVSGITTITVDVPRIPASPPSCVVKLTFKVRAQTQCFTNTAQVSYTSLPGSGTQINPTSSVTPCVLPSHEDCERVYNASGQASITAACPPCANKPPNMVSWWPLNEQPGATVVTDITSGHNGTPLPSGSIVIGNAVPGKVGGALYVVNNNLTVADHPSLRFGNSNLSIDAWFGSRQPQFVSGIVDKLDVGSKQGYALYIENRFLKFVMGDGISFKTYTCTAQLNITNTAMSWNHVAVTVDRSSGVGTFYINGSAVVGTFVPVAIGTNISNTSALLIGGSRLPFSTCVCEYTLDEIEIFGGVLSPSDIKALFAAGPTGKCP